MPTRNTPPLTNTVPAPLPIDVTPAVLPPPPVEVVGWQRLIVALLLIWSLNYTTGFLTGVFAGLSAVMTGANPRAIVLRPQVIVPLTLFDWLVALTITWIFACMQTGSSVRNAIAARAVATRILVSSAFLGFLVAVVVICVALAVRHTDSPIQRLIFVGAAGVGVRRPSPLMFAFMLIAPPIEEVYYRGFLYTTLRQLASVRIALPLVSLWFTLIHRFQVAGDLRILGGLLCVSLLCTWLRERHDSIAPSLACHWVYNGTLISASLIAWGLGN